MGGALGCWGVGAGAVLSLGLRKSPALGPGLGIFFLSCGMEEERPALQRS